MQNPGACLTLLSAGGRALTQDLGKGGGGRGEGGGGREGGPYLGFYKVGRYAVIAILSIILLRNKSKNAVECELGF